MRRAANNPLGGGLGRRLPAVAVAVAVLLPATALSQQGGQPAAPPAGAGQAAPAGPPRIAAKAWALVDPRDGAVLAAKGADRRLPIASATKLMTAHLALQRLKPGRRLVAPPYAALPAESLIGLRAGEKMTVRDLLYGLILESGNDAAVTVAQGVSGSVPRFVALMNREAQAMGLDDTSFENPIGLDGPANYSSAADLVELTEELLANRLFARIADSPSAVLRSGHRPRRIDSRNILLDRDPSVDGVKTGHTQGAGYVLVGSATRNGTRLISAVLGAGSESARDAETLKLLNYGFSLYRTETPIAAAEELAESELDYRDDRLALVAARPVEVSAREGQAIETEIEAPEEISGAVEEGETIGVALVTVDGRPAGSSPLVAAESVAAADLLDKAVASAQNPLILLPVGAFVIVVGLVLAARGRHPAESEPQPGRPKRREREGGPQERTPEERRKMHEKRMRRRRQRQGKS